MKEIQCSQNQVALVDDENFKRLNRYKWRACKDGNIWYALCSRGRRNIRMHHLVIGKPPKGFVTDHKDNNGLHNWEDNLRFVTHRKNLQNTNRTKSSVYSGVCWNKRCRKWEASITFNRKKRHLGLFKNEKEAAQVYQNALKEIENPRSGETAIRRKDNERV